MKRSTLSIKYLFALLLAMLSITLPSVAYAQDDKSTTVILQNGDKVTGKVVEAVPGKMMKIQKADGTIVTIQAADIKQIRTDETKKEHKVKYLLVAGVDVGYDVSSGNKYLMIEPRLINGVSIKGYAIGFGFGGIIANNSSITENKKTPGPMSFKKMNYIPVYLNFNAQIGHKKIKPWIDISGGYPAALQEEVAVLDVYIPGHNSYYFVHGSKGVAYGNIIAGVTVKLGPVALGFGVKYNLLAYNEYFRYDEEPYNGPYTGVSTTTHLKSDRNVLSHSIGASINIIY